MRPPDEDRRSAAWSRMRRDTGAVVPTLDSPGRRLIGRRHECGVIDELLAQVCAGSGQVLVIRGEAGIGKTAMLTYAAGVADNCRVVWATGVESEMELPFAGLQQFCSPFLDALDRLPGPQRDALATAFGMRSGDTPDRLLVGLAVLGLLAEAAAERPLLCLVDDGHWLDDVSAQTLGFVARRLARERVGIVCTMRWPDDDLTAGDLPELRLAGLADDDAHALFDAVFTGPIDEKVRRRFVSETRGNPLALVQLPRGMTPAEVAGGFSGPGALASRIEESFRRRLAPFPPRTKQLLLVAAAESQQDPVVVWRAAEALGLGVEDAEPAVADGYLDLQATVRFCHPIARTTVYRSAAPEQRRRVHALLAEAVGETVAPDRRVWHLALATVGLDEAVAAELERSAERVSARAGIAAAAAFLERSAELTPDPMRRAQRASTAARAKNLAGAPERALRLLAIAEAGPPDELIGAQAQLLRAQIATRQGCGSDAPLLDAAERLLPLDRALARATYRDALYAALVAGRLAGRGSPAAVAAAARAALGPPAGDDPQDLVLDGSAALVLGGYTEGVRPLQRAVRAFCVGDTAGSADLVWFQLASRMSFDVWDDRSCDELSQRFVGMVSKRGALNVLPFALTLRTGFELFAGNFGRAAELAEQALSVAGLVGAPHAPYGQIGVAAWRGDRAAVTRSIAAANHEMSGRGEGQWITACGYFRALVNNASGDYQAALEAAEVGSAHPNELTMASWSMVELVEAAARLGRPERGEVALRRIGEIAEACRTDWALGVHARLSAMLAEGATAESGFRAALDRLGRTRIRTELARAHLVYGEWLRREGRRVDARGELQQALEQFDDMGMAGFAERAHRELSATGATARRRSVDTVVDLTDQEAQIAGLAAEGMTNPEIGMRLFLSPRTVEWHLRKVFAKLGIASRKHLASALSAADRSAGGVARVRPRRER